ncbi:MAG: site-specific integrase [Ignavibacteriae bacterium]|nr:MAG: site-specific integrase [Ignavibacteriota bacterium]
MQKVFNTYIRKIFKKGTDGKYLKEANGKNIVLRKQLSIYWYEEKFADGKLKKEKKTHMPPDWVKTKADLNKYLKTYVIPDSSIPKNAEVMDFKSYTDILIKGMENGYSKSTKSIYQRTCGYFISLVGNKPIKMYTYDDIVNFKNLRKVMSNLCIKNKDVPYKPISPVTVNIELRDLHHIFEEAVNSGYMLKNPCSKVTHEIVAQKPRRNFSNRDIPLILNAIKRPKLKIATIIALNTGMRLNEILHLQFDDFVFKDDYHWQTIYIRFKACTPDEFKEFAMSILDHIKIENKPNFTLKDHDNRNVILIWEVFEIVFEEYIKMADANVFNLNGYILGSLLNKNTASQYLNKVIRSLGFPAGRYVFHSTRHTALTNMLHAGIPLDTVQAIAGHASPLTTVGYAHPDFEAEREKFNKIRYSSL